MPKTTLRTSFLLTTALLGACFSGPNQLEYYNSKVPALTVHARFAGLPTGYVAYPNLDLAMVSSPASALAPGATRLPPTQTGNRGDLNAGGEAQFTVHAGGSTSSSNLPMENSPLRFFRLGVSFTEPGGTTGQDTWTAVGYDLVWAMDVTKYYSAGPASPSVTFPKGYSWLRRQCGPSAGQIQLDVRPVEEAVVFQKVDRFLLWDPYYLEASERRFLESCGAVIPAQDLGTRVSFDRVTSQALIVSTDGALLYYLSEADEQDPTKTVGLRQIRLADGVSAELVTVALGSNLQQDATGQLYVTTGSELALVSRPTTGPATLVDLPFPGTGRVSPDGQWIARYGYTSETTILWSIAAGAEVATIPGTLVDWSPDSQLLYRTKDLNHPTVSLISPANPSLPATFSIGQYRGNPAWGTLGPVWVTIPDTWYVVSGEFTNSVCLDCLGLSLNNLVDGSERKVLDASVGRIYPLSMPPILDSVLVWATKCLGLHDTVCSDSLIRINPTTGATQTVAVAANKYPIGLSSDGKHLAIAAPTGIYIKTLSP